MYNCEKILKIFETSALYTEPYQTLFTIFKQENTPENPIDYYFSRINSVLDSSLIQLFSGKECISDSGTEFQFILKELRPIVVSKLYLYLCNSLVEDYPINDINKLFSQFCAQYQSLGLDAVKDDIKKPKKEFFNRVMTYEDPNGVNPYYLFQNFKQTAHTGKVPNGLILGPLMDYLNESIKFTTKGSEKIPSAINSLIPTLHLIFIKNYSLLPGHGYRKNSFSFDNLDSMENETKRMLLENGFKTTINCRCAELLYKSLLDEILPFERIRNTFSIYLNNHYDLKTKQLSDPGYAFLSLYYIIMDLPTVSLQNHFAKSLRRLIERNNENHDSESSDSIFDFWEKLSNLSKVIYPLSILYLFRFLWDDATQNCGKNSDEKAKIAYTKNLIEDYVERIHIEAHNDNNEIASFSELGNYISCRKSIENDIIYGLLSPYNHTLKNLWGINGYLRNHQMPFSEIHQRSYARHLSE